MVCSDRKYFINPLYKEYETFYIENVIGNLWVTFFKIKSNFTLDKSWSST